LKRVDRKSQIEIPLPTTGDERKISDNTIVFAAVLIDSERINKENRRW